MAAVTVVGGGVIGLTCAVALARAGHAVTVVSADPVSETTSAVAAALWFPYAAAPADAVLRWGQVSLARFSALAGEAGVALREGTVVYRSADRDLAWTRVVPSAVRVADGVRCTLPVIEMAAYLPWLEAEARAAGVGFVRRRVDRLASVDGVVVLAAGLASGALAGDGAVVGVRGQVVRLANPGLSDWLVDEEHPDGLTYVVPRADDVVCGGTADAGGPELDAATEAAILARVRALVPALADAPVVSRAVGLRPVRPEVRLERVGDVVHCYGHGGAGVTLSWGCADDVVRLIG